MISYNALWILTNYPLITWRYRNINQKFITMLKYYFYMKVTNKRVYLVK